MEAISPSRARTLIRGAGALLGAAGLLVLGIALAGGDLTDALDDLGTVLLALAAVLALSGWAHERRSGAARAALGGRPPPLPGAARAAPVEARRRRRREPRPRLSRRL